MRPKPPVWNESFAESRNSTMSPAAEAGPIEFSSSWREIWARDDPAVAEQPVVAQRVVLAAERLLAEVGQRLAVQLVVVVVDRAGVVARILEEGADERLASVMLKVSLAGGEVAVAGRVDDLARRGPAGRTVLVVFDTRS